MQLDLYAICIIMKDGFLLKLEEKRKQFVLIFQKKKNKNEIKILVIQKFFNKWYNNDKTAYWILNNIVLDL